MTKTCSVDITKIISGGRTGADRAGLVAAIALNIPHGGWCPQGRRALDGTLVSKYQLTETPSKDYPQRTEWNVRDSDGTIIFTLSETLSGGSLKTEHFARKHKKPSLHLNPATIEPARTIQDFVSQHSITTLNIAGSRETKEPGVYEWTKEILFDALPPWLIQAAPGHNIQHDEGVVYPGMQQGRRLY